MLFRLNLPESGQVFRTDFVNLWVAGRLTLAGEIATIFEPRAFQQATSAIFREQFTTNNYSYPPFALFLAAPFGLLPYYPALLLWNGVGVASFTWAAKRLVPPEFPWWLAAFTPAGLVCLFWGHYGLLYGTLWLLAFTSTPLRSGVCAALMTFKPHLGLLLLPQALRNRRTLMVAICGTLLLSVAGGMVFGWPSWREFFTTTLRFQADLISEERRTQLMFLQVSPVISYGWIGQVYFGLIACWITARCFNVFTAATGTFLVLPYCFHYDMTAASLGFAVALWRYELPTWQQAICALAFLSPALVLFGNFLVPPILLAGLWVLSRQQDGTDYLSTLFPGKVQVAGADRE
jgi:hypothetical protein